MSVPRFSVSQITTMTWPFERDVEVFAAVGAPAIGVSLGKLQQVGVARADALIRGSGLAVSCITTAGMYALANPDRVREQVEETKRLIAEIARLEPSCLMIASGNDPTRAWEENLPLFLRVVEALLPEAEQHNVRLAIEPMSTLRMDLSFIHSLDEALDIADQVDSPYLGVTFEVNNAWIERRLYQNIAERWRRFFIVQVNDFKIGTLCTPQRVVMGDGDIPLKRILPAIRAAGYDGYYDIELIGPAIDAEGYESVVPRAVAAYRALWDSGG